MDAIIDLTKLVTCTFCGETIDSDDIIEHGINVHNHHMAKVIQQKKEELERMIGRKLKPSDIVDDDLMQAFLELSRKMREDGR